MGTIIVLSLTTSRLVSVIEYRQLNSFCRAALGNAIQTPLLKHNREVVMTRKIAMIATFALLGIIPALAQDARGRVRGTVTDGSGASITKATVILTNSETRISAQQETSPSGQYIFDFVLPGTYTVQVELSGFKKFLQKNLLVSVKYHVGLLRWESIPF